MSRPPFDKFKRTGWFTAPRALVLTASIEDRGLYERGLYERPAHGLIDSRSVSRAVEESNRRLLRARDAMDRSYAQPLQLSKRTACVPANIRFRVSFNQMSVDSPRLAPQAPWMLQLDAAWASSTR
jgi:hypothetical protein